MWLTLRQEVSVNFGVWPKTRIESCAGIAQLVEQLICNQQVGGSSPSASSVKCFDDGSATGRQID